MGSTHYYGRAIEDARWVTLYEYWFLQSISKMMARWLVKPLTLVTCIADYYTVIYICNEC